MRLILHQDDTLVSFDNQRLIEYTREFDCRHTMSYEHKRTHDELLSAIPDAIAWCCGKGGQWHQLIKPTIAEMRDV